MDFDLGEEQSLLKDSVERLMRERYDFDARKKYAQEPGGYSHELWTQYAELGLLAVPFAEEHGGIGGGAVEIMLVMEAFGRALALEPYLATVVLAGGLVRHGGSAAQKQALLPGIIAGENVFAFGHTERQSRYDLFDVETKARRDGQGFLLDGQKGVVLNGDSAGRILVTARAAGGRREREGIGLFLVDADAAGVSRQSYATQDGRRAAEITLRNVHVPADAVIGDPEDALPLVERVVDEAIAATGAASVGAMDELLKLTVDYLKTRKQFGTAIGSFQVLQHRCSDMFVALEQARSMAMLAAMMVQESDATERRKSISAAKVQIGRSAQFIGQSAVQLHGGVGMTMELKVGHLFKSLTISDILFGDADHHLALLAQAGGLIAA